MVGSASMLSVIPVQAWVVFMSLISVSVFCISCKIKACTGVWIPSKWFTAEVLSRKTQSTERKIEKLKRNSVGPVQTHPSAWNLDMGTEAQWSSVQPWLIVCTCMLAASQLRPVSTPTLLHQHRARNCSYRKTDRPSLLGASSGCVRPPAVCACIPFHMNLQCHVYHCCQNREVLRFTAAMTALWCCLSLCEWLDSSVRWQTTDSSAQSVLEGGGVCWGKILQIIACRRFQNEISNEFLKRICCCQQFINIDINPARGLKLPLWLPIIIFHMLGPAIICIISL